MNKVMNIKKLAITAVIALIAVLISFDTGRLLADPPDVPPGLEIAIEVQEAHTPDLLGKPEVVGTAVGLDDQGKPVIQVFTKSARFSGIPNNIEGFPVEVVVTGEFFALAACIDNDKDGYFKKTKTCTQSVYDCNDKNGSIHPLACEVCDGKDNDCDSFVDEQCGPCPTPTPTPTPTPSPTPTPIPTPTPAPTPTPTPSPTPTPIPTPTPAPTPTPTPSPTPTPIPTPSPSPSP